MFQSIVAAVTARVVGEIIKRPGKTVIGALVVGFVAGAFLF